MRLNTFEQAREFAAGLMEEMRANLERDGHLAPMAFVLATQDPATGAVLASPRPILTVLDFSTPRAKLESAQRLRDLGRRTDAVMVLTGVESFSVEFETLEQARAAALAGVGAHAKRTEIVCVTLEHRRGRCTWFARIARDGSGRPRLGPFERQAVDEESGAFSGFLAPQAGPPAVH